jgi:antitoxin (DNA-binding transcriptional repressor) of toxin-antitoxin stability system
MITITIEEAQARLAELIGGLEPGAELAITSGDRVVARIVGQIEERRERPENWQRPGPGLAKGILSIVEDDDEHLEDFAEYMS